MQKLFNLMFQKKTQKIQNHVMIRGAMGDQAIEKVNDVVDESISDVRLN
jgi:hypothetical protein